MRRFSFERAIRSARGFLRPRRRLIALTARGRGAIARAEFRRLVRTSFPVDPAGETVIPVIMCLWGRPERLAAVLEMLSVQTGAGSLRLYLWNNDRREQARYLSTLAGWAPSGALRSVRLHSSRINIGGSARFLIARSLRRGGYRGPVILLDDDQQVSPDFVARLLAAGGPRTYAGVWAWRIHGDYWDRTAAASGEAATYVGTGGAVTDVELVGSEELVSTLPVHRLFLEDMWLSAFAIRHGYELRGVEAEYEFTDLEGNQWHAIAESKSAFYDELGRPGLLPR